MTAQSTTVFVHADAQMSSFRLPTVKIYRFQLSGVIASERTTRKKTTVQRNAAPKHLSDEKRVETTLIASEGKNHLHKNRQKSG
jgi:hypothetical protein